MKKPLAFITGIAGFAGFHLTRELLANGFEVAGSVYKDDPPGNVAELRNMAALYKMDILRAADCRKVISKVKPDYLFHLAAFSSVGQSFANEGLTYRINFDGTLNVLEAAHAIKKLKKMIFVSSSECYGEFRPKGKILTEEQPFNPMSPYAISKAAAEFACRMYWKRYGLPVTIARSFNHSGPRQNENFVVPAFAKQIAALEKTGGRAVIRTGELSARRDLSDVRDIVRGYRLLALKGTPGKAYHFCSGEAISIKAVLNQLLKLSDREISISIDKTRLRKNDIPILRGDNSLAVRELGFRITIPLKTTLEDTLNYWRTIQNR